MPIQQPHTEFPTGSQLACNVQRDKYSDSLLTSLPVSILPLGQKILDLQTSLVQTIRQYDYARLTEIIKIRELNVAEEKLLKRLKSELRVQKEREKLGKQLRGGDKKLYKKTGKLPHEVMSELMESFKAFMAAQGREV